MNPFQSLARSFGHAWRGLCLAFRTERSFRVHVAVAAVVCLVLFLFPLSSFEQIILLLATGSVLVLELLNSTVERLIDVMKPRLHMYVADIKDLMAAAVLLASLFVAVIGLMIVLPHLMEVVRHLL